MAKHNNPEKIRRLKPAQVVYVNRELATMSVVTNLKQHHPPTVKPNFQQVETHHHKHQNYQCTI